MQMVTNHGDKLEGIGAVETLLQTSFHVDVLSWMLKNLSKLDQQTWLYIKFMEANPVARKELTLDLQTLVQLEQDTYLSFSIICNGTAKWLMTD
jgi:hypothetical protein